MNRQKFAEFLEDTRCHLSGKAHNLTNHRLGEVEQMLDNAHNLIFANDAGYSRADMDTAVAMVRYVRRRLDPLPWVTLDDIM